MDDNGTHIEQYPSRISVTFTMIGKDTFFLQRFVDFLADGFYLAVAIGTADYKIVGEGANLPGIQDNNILSQLVRSRFNCLPGYFYRFQYRLPLLYLTILLNRLYHIPRHMIKYRRFFRCHSPQANNLYVKSEIRNPKSQTITQIQIF
jgi:hypothetical protein